LICFKHLFFTTSILNPHSSAGITMAEIYLTQAEADSLFNMKKIKVDDTEWKLPDFGGKLCIPLISYDKKERFSLDFRRGSIDLTRQTYQTRARDAVVLARLDIGSPHRNPDGVEVGVPHLHLYREGYGDKWAFELPEGVFANINDRWQTLADFMKYCNIVQSPNFTRDLFT
jgi:hypothetical protein